jgi:tetratricopeptide (TPR) repeat protein
MQMRTIAHSSRSDIAPSLAAAPALQLCNSTFNPRPCAITLKPRNGGFAMITESIWRTYTDVGCTAYSQGNYELAEKMFLSALENLDLSKTPAIRVGAAYRNLAVACHKQSKLAEAQQYYKKALVAYQNSQVADPALIAWTLDGLAETYFSTRDFIKARPLFKRVLKLYEQLFGEASPVLAPRLLRLGWIACSTGKADQAVEYFNRAKQLKQLKSA